MTSNDNDQNRTRDKSQDQNDTDMSKFSREASTPSPVSPVRSFAGSSSVQLSEWINHNIVVARYAAITSIGLLAAYGLSHSPLFFRYRNVAEIPAKHFLNRMTLIGRVMNVSQTTPEGPILCQVRFLLWFPTALDANICSFSSNLLYLLLLGRTCTHSH